MTCPKCNNKGEYRQIGTWLMITCECQKMKDEKVEMQKQTQAQEWIELFNWCQKENITPSQIKEVFQDSDKPTHPEAEQLEVPLESNPTTQLEMPLERENEHA